MTTGGNCQNAFWGAEYWAAPRAEFRKIQKLSAVSLPRFLSDGAELFATIAGYPLVTH
jgi:hypothetical protein